MHAITNENFNSVQAHFAGEVRQNDGLTVRKLHTKKGVWKRLIYDALYNLWFSHICVAKNSNK